MTLTVMGAHLRNIVLSVAKETLNLGHKGVPKYKIVKSNTNTFTHSFPQQAMIQIREPNGAKYF